MYINPLWKQITLSAWSPAVSVINVSSWYWCYDLCAAKARPWTETLSRHSNNFFFFLSWSCAPVTFDISYFLLCVNLTFIPALIEGDNYQTASGSSSWLKMGDPGKDLVTPKGESLCLDASNKAQSNKQRKKKCKLFAFQHYISYDVFSENHPSTTIYFN